MSMQIDKFIEYTDNRKTNTHWKKFSKGDYHIAPNITHISARTMQIQIKRIDRLL